MSIQFFCSNCGTPLTAPDNAAGKRGTCPKCKSLFVVPGVAAPIAEPPPLPILAGPVATPHPKGDAPGASIVRGVRKVSTLARVITALLIIVIVLIVLPFVVPFLVHKKPASNDNDSAATAKLLADFEHRLSVLPSGDTTAAQEARVLAILDSMQGMQVTLTCSVLDVEVLRHASSNEPYDAVVTVTRPRELPWKWECNWIRIPHMEATQALKLRKGETIVLHGTLGGSYDVKGGAFSFNVGATPCAFVLHNFSYSVLP